ncbi:winged helix-turn-helix transcriptional regulator [Saccharospirillum mangrovi]|uniref:winged helix-turn-helix transcriptional regulator n=1 Tax=Saccharospirillum mangrovi TaxID=2161747 RepID=UPI000D3658CB|nr:helix-turn-helix domain-containing protein [Saccharospirillum mangrovi]
MPRTDFSAMYCSLARSLNIVGDGWTQLILRDLFLGNRRFSGLQANLGISKKVLTERLDVLLGEGLIEMQAYGESGGRFEYHLTEKGSELGPVLLALMAWGDKWVSNNKAPVKLTHPDCGATVQAQVVCSHCAEPINFDSVKAQPGPGMPEAERQRIAALKMNWAVKSANR